MSDEKYVLAEERASTCFAAPPPASVMEDRPRISARKASLRPIRRFYVVPGTEQNNTVYCVEMLTSSSSSCVRRASVTAEDLLGSF